MTNVTMLAPWIEVPLRTATLIDIKGNVAARVRFEEEPDERLCHLLCSSDTPLSLAPGDVVLVWQPAPEDQGVILGRLGPSHAPTPEASSEPPEELVLEARHSLTLRVGSGSITIREDGKILIKGKDLVSHATRLNRIKGGAVQIN